MSVSEVKSHHGLDLDNRDPTEMNEHVRVCIAFYKLVIGFSTESFISCRCGSRMHSPNLTGPTATTGFGRAAIGHLRVQRAVVTSFSHFSAGVRVR